MHFARLPAPALEVVRRVVDEDEDFRGRVTAATTEEAVGEAGWLWLTRPEGWRAKVDALRREAQEREAAARDDRSERDARRRLTGAEAAARKAEASASASAADAEVARRALAEEQRARDEADARLAQLVADVAAAAEDRAGAIRELKRTEAALASRTGEVKRLQHQVRMLEAELEQALQGGAGGDTADSVVRAAAAAPEAAGLDREQLAAFVGEARRAASALTDALAGIAGTLGLPDTPLDPSAADAHTEQATDRAPAAPEDETVSRRSTTTRRRPARLPPAVLHDTAEAAEYLVRLPGAIVVVDGYNVSKTAWPERPIAEQRTRLVDALAELHLRAGPRVEVVFDGVESDGPSAPVGRTGVRVRFSPADVEADDVVLALAADLPSDRPIVVASSDRRVRDGAERLGANVVSARQLLGALRR